MKKQLHFLSLGATLLLSAMSYGQTPNCTINASANPICIGSTTTLSVNASASETVWWSDGSTGVNSITVQPNQTAVYSVIISDGVNTCSENITVQVNNPQINAGQDQQVCAGSQFTLTATGAQTYSWDNGVTNGQPFTFTTEGYYTVTGTDALGCSNTAAVYLDLIQPTSSTISPKACNTYTAPDGAIYTNTGTYTAIIPNAVGCDSTITINLVVNNATSSTISPTVCETYTAPNGTIYTNSGTYTAVIPNAVGCDSTITINLTVHSNNSGLDTRTVCDSLKWIDGITYYSNNNSATFTLMNVNGCDSVVTLNLTVNKLTSLNAGNDVTLCKGENIVLTASGASLYDWNYGVTDGVAFVQSVGSGTYTVTGTDANGCKAKDSVVVLVENCFNIPPAFSPNGDNSNDTWKVTGLDKYPNSEVQVFDRWGQKVFTGNATSAYWDGKLNDKELPSADYYYIITLGNGENFNGVVTLKR